MVISIAGILFATPPDRAKNFSALPIMSRRVRGEDRLFGVALAGDVGDGASRELRRRQHGGGAVVDAVTRGRSADRHVEAISQRAEETDAVLGRAGPLLNSDDLAERRVAGLL